MSLIKFLLIFVLMPVFAFAQERGPEPLWIDRIDAPPDAQLDADQHVEGGVFDILTDRQILLHHSGYDVYEKTVQKVVSRLGLEEVGTLRIDFDPVDETLVVHDIWRVRQGVRSRVTGLDFLTIRRESEIDYGILDGRLTHYADISDVRVGDIIEVSWSRYVAREVFAGHFLEVVTAKPFEDTFIERTRLLAPADIEISVNGPAQPNMSRRDEFTEYVWLSENETAPEYDYETQSWEEVFGKTYVSKNTDWATVVEEVRDAYQPTELPTELSAEIATFTGTQDQRVAAAFRLVQERIRYMGIEIGAGGYLPRAPSLVWSRRFGDCKDKALLLVSMLTEMGVSADVVLVHNRRGADLADHPPSPYAFNHAIVRVRGGNGDYFLDPTDVLQGGVGPDIATLDFVWALPLSEGSDALVAVPRPKSNQPEYEVISRYDFAAEGTVHVAELTETTIYRGRDADRQRHRFLDVGKEARSRSYLEWYQETYPGAFILTPLRVEDDLDSNTLTVHEHYGLTDEGLEEHREEFWMNPYAVKGELPTMSDEGIETAYEVTPLFHRHRVELVGVDGLEPFPEHLFSNKFFRFERTSFEIQGGVAGVFELETRADEILPGEVEAYEEARLDARSKRDRRYRIDTYSLSDPLLLGLRTDHSVMLLVALFALGLSAVGFRRGWRSVAAK